jgi:hypothetical protein
MATILAGLQDYNHVFVFAVVGEMKLRTHIRYQLSHPWSLSFLGVHEGYNHFLVFNVVEEKELGPHQDTSCPKHGHYPEWATTTSLLSLLWEMEIRPHIRYHCPTHGHYHGFFKGYNHFFVVVVVEEMELRPHIRSYLSHTHFPTWVSMRASTTSLLPSCEGDRAWTTSGCQLSHTWLFFYLGIHEGYNHFLVFDVVEEIELEPHQDTSCPKHVHYPGSATTTSLLSLLYGRWNLDHTLGTIVPHMVIIMGFFKGYNHFFVVVVVEEMELRPHIRSYLFHTHFPTWVSMRATTTSLLSLLRRR